MLKKGKSDGLVAVPVNVFPSSATVKAVVRLRTIARNYYQHLVHPKLLRSQRCDLWTKRLYPRIHGFCCRYDHDLQWCLNRRESDSRWRCSILTGNRRPCGTTLVFVSPMWHLYMLSSSKLKPTGQLAVKHVRFHHVLFLKTEKKLKYVKYVKTFQLGCN